MRKNQSVIEVIDVTDAKLVDGFVVDITFSDDTRQRIDFLPTLKKIAKGYYAKYLKPENFRKFKIEGGNIVWGKDWDLIFPVHKLHAGKL